MTRILVVCGAGASSTFLASRLRTLASSRGVELTVEAASDADVAARLAGIDVLLVGPHLEASFDSLRSAAEEFGVVTALLPENAFGPTGAEAALDHSLSLLASGELASGGLASGGLAPGTQMPGETGSTPTTEGVPRG